MSIFSLFKKPKKPNKYINENINCKIAASCLKSTAYTSESDTLDYAVVGVFRKHHTDIDYTESYFYEEAAYCLMNVLEMQERYGYIDTYVSVINASSDMKEMASTQEVFSCLKKVIADIATKRLSIAGVRQTLSIEKISDYLEKRYFDYEGLAKAHSSSIVDVTSNEWSAGLTPRDHPLKVYLGVIANNMSSSLNIDKNDGLSMMVLEKSLLVNYMSAMNAANTVTSNLQSLQNG